MAAACAGGNDGALNPSQFATLWERLFSSAVASPEPAEGDLVSPRAAAVMAPLPADFVAPVWCVQCSELNCLAAASAPTACLAKEMGLLCCHAAAYRLREVFKVFDSNGSGGAPTN
eukprot:COSAG01_NODE_897_length_12874_cov_17.636115_10_plen_116_part_00